MATTAAPLQNHRIVGVVSKVWQAAPGLPSQPAGTCWHCGQGIMICVQAEDRETGEIHDIGTTCAERIGLNPVELKQFLAEKFAEDRALRRAADAEARREARRIAELEAAGLLGEHGTAQRFVNGCYCDRCFKAAPHGTAARFNQDCRCDECVAEILNVPGSHGYKYAYTILDRDYLVDVETGKILNGRKVETKYGYRWVVNDEYGARWFPVGAKRRSTYTNKGVTVVEIPTLIERIHGHRGTWYKQYGPVADKPALDIWGEEVPS